MSDRLREAMQTLSEAGTTRETCPSPEIWHEFASGFLGEPGTLSSDGPWTAKGLESHVAICGVCAAELELARAFAAEASAASSAPMETSRAGSPELDATDSAVASLETARAARAAAEESAPSTLQTWAGVRGWLAAAAVLLALTAGYSFWAMRPPAVEGPGSGAVMRGEGVTLSAPLDEIDGIPERLEWLAADGVESYQVEIRRLDGRIVLSREVSTPVLRLTAAERRALEPFVTYEWEVRARVNAGAGGETETGATASFTIRTPSGESN